MSTEDRARNWEKAGTPAFFGHSNSTSEHKNWAHIIEDAKYRLEEGTTTEQELNALEYSENQGRIAIRQKFRQRTETLMEKQQFIEVELAKQKSKLAAVRRVDGDSLLEIFKCYVDAGGSPWFLAHTCSQWRRVVLSSKQLWAGILLTSNLDIEVKRRLDGKEVCNSLSRLERAFQRVGDAPIDLAISLVWSHKTLDIQSTVAMIVRAARSCANWTTLHIENSEKVLNGDYIFPTDTFGHGLPNLTNVSFHSQHNAHAEPSRGLLPFRGLLDTIYWTSKQLRSVHFHGFGRNERTDNYFASPIPIEELSVIQAEPRFIQQAYRTLLSACPTSLVGWRYATFTGADDINPAKAHEASFGFIVPDRRIAIHQGIHAALGKKLLRSVNILDIIAHPTLKLSRPLHLPYIVRLSVYSEDLDHLQYIDAPILGCLQITLSSKEDHHIHASMLSLERLWKRGPAPLPGQITLEGVGVSKTVLRNLSIKNKHLKRVEFMDVTFQRHGALLGLTDAVRLDRLKIRFTNKLGIGQAERLSEDIRALLLAQKCSNGVGLKVTLGHASEEKVFIREPV